MSFGLKPTQQWPAISIWGMQEHELSKLKQWLMKSAFLILPVVEVFEKLHPDIGLVGVGRNSSKEWNMNILKYELWIKEVQ